MKFKDFEYTMSPSRMFRYVKACNNDTRKAMTLYRKNLKLSHELFIIIGCFEVALRNAIDRHCLIHLGPDWLYHSVCSGGIFDNPSYQNAANAVRKSLLDAGVPHQHNKVVAHLGFGFWRNLFSRHQYRLTGQHLLNIFVAKPASSILVKYNAHHVFNRLVEINAIRIRIAHHEPICFLGPYPVISTRYARNQYENIQTLFKWLGIDEEALLYGLDHIVVVCDEIDAL